MVFFLTPCMPINRAKKACKSSGEIQGFKIISTAGHTPGHFSGQLKSKNETAVFIGEIVHSHTAPFDQPETAIDMIYTRKKQPKHAYSSLLNMLKAGRPLLPRVYYSPALSTQKMAKLPVHF